MSLFLFLFCISLGQYCRKSLAKNERFGKNIPKKGDGHNRGSCLKKGGSNLLNTMILSGWKGGPLSPKLERGPDLKGGTSCPFSYHAFNLASYNWIVSCKSGTCLMLFPRVNLKMHLGEKHQRSTTVTSTMPILKRPTSGLSILFPIWYMVYLYGIYYILQ